mmetsp:Transcript_24775/g.51518  ORF Transcript_24775/g.51518 Transcript_24775/m.51518 type:complete len:385 (-) Transcript_24775:197-1351(-)
MMEPQNHSTAPLNNEEKDLLGSIRTIESIGDSNLNPDAKKRKVEDTGTILKVEEPVGNNVNELQALLGGPPATNQGTGLNGFAPAPVGNSENPQELTGMLQQQQQQQSAQLMAPQNLGFPNMMGMQQVFFQPQNLQGMTNEGFMQSQQGLAQQSLLQGMPQMFDPAAAVNASLLGSMPFGQSLFSGLQPFQGQQFNQQQQQQQQFPLAMQMNQFPTAANVGLVGAPGVAPSMQTGRKPLALLSASDEKHLTDYQCLVRKHIEVFEASPADIDTKAQGRNRPITLGQVGIRCVCCSKFPPSCRILGAVYFPSKLEGIYQSAQNMVNKHLLHCKHAPEELRKKLAELKTQKGAAGGGKRYWADSAKALGVYEGDRALYFTPKEPTA